MFSKEINGGYQISGGDWSDFAFFAPVENATTESFLKVLGDGNGFVKPLNSCSLGDDKVVKLNFKEK